MAVPEEIRSPKLYNISRFTNILNAFGLGIIGVLHIMNGKATAAGGVQTLQDLVLCIYLVLFSLILFAFNIPKSCFCRGFYTSMIFMYSPMGRIFLFLLVGTMAVVVDTYGVYVMGATYANMVFNVIVVFICKEYCLKMRLKHSKREYIKSEEEMGKIILPPPNPEVDVEEGEGKSGNKDNKNKKPPTHQKAAYEDSKSSQYSTAEVSQAYKDAMDYEARESGVKNGKGKAKDYEYKPHHSVGSLPDGWQRFYDKRSQSYYYYNSRTEETSWEHPNERR